MKSLEQIVVWKLFDCGWGSDWVVVDIVCLFQPALWISPIPRVPKGFMSQFKVNKWCTRRISRNRGIFLDAENNEFSTSSASASCYLRVQDQYRELLTNWAKHVMKVKNTLVKYYWFFIFSSFLLRPPCFFSFCSPRVKPETLLPVLINHNFSWTYFSCFETFSI